jgi:plastocyanin
MPVMAVFKGDKVVIHFFNIEEPGADNHSFTIYKPYNIDVVVHPRENKTITFVANTTGTFTYLCTFHQPTMMGQLIVLPHP